MKSTFSKYLLIVLALGATTFILQTANGRPATNSMDRSIVGSAPQAIVMDTPPPIVRSDVNVRQRKMAE